MIKNLQIPSNYFTIDSMILLNLEINLPILIKYYIPLLLANEILIQKPSLIKYTVMHNILSNICFYFLWYAGKILNILVKSSINLYLHL